MNVRHIKTLSWIGALAIGGWLGWTIYDFLQQRPLLAAGIPQETQKSLLNGVEAPPPPQEDSVAYEVVTRAFQHMNWPGRPPEAAPVEEAKPEDEGPRYKPVAELLAVQFLQVDRGGDRSLAWVKFLDPQLVQAAKRAEDKILAIGESLAKPWDGITIKDITPEGVLFSFTEVEGQEQREDELVAASTFERTTSRIVVVGEDGVILPEEQGRIEASPPIDWKPRETTMMGENLWQIGSDTAGRIDQDYSEILTRDLDYRAFRDPSTKKITGIEITKVRDGSLPSQHGLSEGEVLKSINGHTVTSVSDAVNYVKKNADTTDVWVAVFESRGREFTRTYRSPPE